jgi:membrane protease YdiL (CAAX protease family)
VNPRTKSGHAPTDAAKLLCAMRAQPLVFFVILAFGLTWSYEVVVFAVLHLSLLPWAVPLPIIGPSVAAFLLTTVMEGRPGVLSLLSRCVLWRVRVRWYVFSLLMIPAMVLPGSIALPESASALPTLTPSIALSYLVTFVEVFIFGGPLFEEPGWRGFAPPRLQRRVGPLVGSLLLGLLWGLWHLPLFWFVSGYDRAGDGLTAVVGAFAQFVILIIPFTVIITWVFNSTRGSVLLAMALHASLNTASAYAPVSPFAWSVRSICAAVVTLVIIWVTRGRLGYRFDPHETAPAAQAHGRPGLRTATSLDALDS